MPIHPENLKRYPPNWSTEIRPAILERAGNRCEGSPGIYPDCRAANGQPHPVTGSRVVLTIAHLAPPIENVDPTNLAALCQRCHLAYDSVTRIGKRDATMDGIQNYINDWSEKTFDNTERGIAAHILSEAAELFVAAGGVVSEAVEIVKSAKQKPLSSIPEETADVIILALTMAGLHKFSARECVMAKMRLLKSRQWGEPNQHGIIEHVVEPSDRVEIGVDVD